MNKKIIIPTILFIVAFVFSFIILLKNRENSSANNNQENQRKKENQIILYYGDGCPHCAVVEKYIEENNIKDKVSFTQKEVYYNQRNAKELAEKAKICNLPVDSIGVPFLWDGKKCFVGDQEIISFFKNKIN